EVEGAVWPFDDDGTLRPDRARDGGLRWTTAEGISQIGRALVDATPGLDLRLQTRVVALEAESDGWTVVLESREAGAASGERHAFDAVLVTAPAPQAFELLSGLEAASSIERVTYRSQFSVMWAFDRVLDRPADVYALVNAAEHGSADGGHDVAWLAVESDKPGRAPDGATLLLAQMSERWTLDHYDDKKPDVVLEAGRAVESLWGPLPEPLWTDTQRWRYSLPNDGVEVGGLEGDGLFVAGDWTAGKGRVHLALEQGLAAAERIRASI
ncbi:FAD-dependent oxidoreductase, partial [Rubrivirga sp.]|uniref:FAD-dependent oxidoreductase n=1 Tax=Rubrivirga sp. TaxID=1885344 RepID=UPI003C7247CA